MDKKCKNCGKVFQSNHRHLYCSIDCRLDILRKELEKAELEKQNTPCRKCEYCGSEFNSRWTQSSRQRFCCKHCRWNAHKAAKLAKKREEADLSPRNCLHCKSEFVPIYGTNTTRQIYCSNECKKAYHKDQDRINRQEIRDNTERICPICDAEFSPTKTLKEIYCSPRCRKLIGRKVYKMMASCYQACETEKAASSHKVLGYSPNQLLEHLQGFPQWNELKNGSWHLDHKFPIIAFVRRGIRDIKLICCLENLQPLPGDINCQKNDSYDEAAFEQWMESVGSRCGF